MKIAVKMAWKGLGNTWTNPRVGAVIVKDGRLVASGYHHQFGEHHAEIDALSNVPDAESVKGATMYVTMEPCSHFGKTPPCSDRLIKEGFKRVVVGQVDPNPIVAGKGIERLRNSGVEVEILGTTTALNEAYNFYYERQRPMVTIKYAMSLDGKINQQSGRRTIISGEEAQADSQKLRRMNQAILVGERTFKTDDPRLTVRGLEKRFQPVRIILVRDANSVTPDKRLFENESPVWILSSQSAHRQFPDFVHVFVKDEWRLNDVLALLSEHHLQSLLVEGGSQIQAEFVRANLVDQLVTYVAPIVIGGTGLPAVSGVSDGRLTHFEAPEVTQLGHDLKITVRRAR